MKHCNNGNMMLRCWSLQNRLDTLSSSSRFINNHLYSFCNPRYYNKYVLEILIWRSYVRRIVMEAQTTHSGQHREVVKRFLMSIVAERMLLGCGNDWQHCTRPRLSSFQQRISSCALNVQVELISQRLLCYVYQQSFCGCLPLSEEFALFKTRLVVQFGWNMALNFFV